MSENYFSTLQQEQRLRSTREHGTQRRVSHMCYISVVLFFVWAALALRDHRPGDAQVVGGLEQAEGGGTTRSGLEMGSQKAGGIIDESVHAETRQQNASEDKDDSDAAAAGWEMALVKATCGWMCLLIMGSAGIIQFREDRYQTHQGHQFPPLPSSQAAGVASPQRGRQSATGARKTHAASPRRGHIGELHRLGATTGATRPLGAGATGLVGGGHPAGQGDTGMPTRTTARTAAAASAGAYNLQQLLADDKRAVEETHAAQGNGVGVNLLGGLNGRGSLGHGGMGGMMPNYNNQQGDRRMQVKFGIDSRGVETNVAATDSEWALLGVRDAELSSIRIAEWISKALHAVSGEIDRCNRWFAEKQLSAFDCSNSLSDLFSVHSASSAPTWGSSTTAAQHAKVDKMQCLKNEKQKLQQQPHNLDVYEMIVHIDLRLKLEILLDVSKTFDPGRGGRSGGAGSNAYESEATRRQTYAIRRIKSLGSQSTLNGFHAAGGEPEVWSEEYPIDAHLVTHVLAHQYPAFARHVKLPHQHMTDRRDLAIFVGSVGEPYFYVKYRNPPAQPEKVFHTKQGPDSMFQALLIFVALIAKYHDNAYGGVFGVVDLEQLGLGNVVRS